MGTPGALTASTTDAVTATSHTHSVTGFIRTATADNKTSGSLIMNDSVNLEIGTGLDMSIYSDGTDVFFDMIDGADWSLRGGTGGTEVMINAISNLGVALYHNGIEVATTLIKDF